MKTHDKTLELDIEDMRTLGYEVIDMLVDYYTELPDKKVKVAADENALEAIISEPPPEKGDDPQKLIAQLKNDILADVEHKIHPRDFAFIPGPGNFIGVLADTIAAGYNIFGGAQITSSGVTMIELQVIDWLRELFGFPKGAGGLFVSGGSVANLTGLAAARHTVLQDNIDQARIYYSDQTHVSNIKALKLLGFQDAHMCKVQSDENFCLDIDDLKAHIDEDKAAGLRAFCIIANAGTTNTGAIDSLDTLTDVCSQENMWLHVDGAFGAAAALSEKAKHKLKGLDRVDSLSFDPHKWFFQPYEIGGILVRNMDTLKQTFSTNAEYLRDIQGPGKEETNFFDYGIQMTRGFRALKMWLSIKTFGFHGIRQAIERGIELAEYAESILTQSSHWQIITPAQLGIITFRYLQPELSEERISEINQQIISSILADGFAFVLSTSLRGKTVLRLCTINPRTSNDDIKNTIDKLGEFGHLAADNFSD